MRKGRDYMTHGGDVYRNQVTYDFSINCNPLGMPEGVRLALTEAVNGCGRYPDIRAERLKRAIGRMTGTKEETLLCGNGASELFFAIVRGLMPKRVLLPVPSFYGYEKAARSCGAAVSFYQMKKSRGFCADEELLEELTKDVDLLFLADPNNPVGNRIEPPLVERLLSRCREMKIVVVLDECFVEFTQNRKACSFFRRAQEYSNLIVVRAFTKIFAIPGVRLGYLTCADPALRSRIEEQLPEWNVSVFAQEAGIAAAGEKAYWEKTAGYVKKERNHLTEQLRKAGIRVFPGTANYLLLYTPVPLGEELLKRRILIRDCSDFRGLSKGYYRIAVKRRKENEILLDAVGDIPGLTSSGR